MPDVTLEYDVKTSFDWRDLLPRCWNLCVIREYTVAGNFKKIRDLHMNILLWKYIRQILSNLSWLRSIPEDNISQVKWKVLIRGQRWKWPRFTRLSSWKNTCPPLSGYIMICSDWLQGHDVIFLKWWINKTAVIRPKNGMRPSISRYRLTRPFDRLIFFCSV